MVDSKENIAEIDIALDSGYCIDLFRKKNIIRFSKFFTSGVFFTSEVFIFSFPAHTPAKNVIAAQKRDTIKKLFFHSSFHSPLFEYCCNVSHEKRDVKNNEKREFLFQIYGRGNRIMTGVKSLLECGIDCFMLKLEYHIKTFFENWISVMDQIIFVRQKTIPHITHITGDLCCPYFRDYEQCLRSGLLWNQYP